MSAAAGESKKIRVAVVGTGEFGRNHARVYRELEGAELIGVFDENQERAAAVAAEFQTQVLKRLDDLRGRVDAASVAVPTVAHRDVGCRLLEMGLDVLVEKPMAVDLAEADALLHAAKKYGRILQVGHVERFNPAVIPVLTERVDIAHARPEFAGGAVANITASRLSTERVRNMRFFQQHEYIPLDYAR